MSPRRRRRAGAGRLPAPLVPLAAVAAAFFVLPVLAILVDAPWSGLGEHLRSDVVVDAMRLSLLTSLAATALALVLGGPLAWVLARGTFPGRSLLRGVVLLPMVLPPVVGGLGLLLALGRRGLAGGPLYDATGIQLPFSVWAVILANLLVAMPFLVVTLEAGLRGVDARLEDAAATLGAGRWYVLRRVTLPAMWPSVVAASVLCWARALGEFGATLTFAGNLQGRTQTMPLAIALANESDRGSAIALSLVLMAVALAVLVPLRDRWLRA